MHFLLIYFLVLVLVAVLHYFVCKLHERTWRGYRDEARSILREYEAEREDYEAGFSEQLKDTLDSLRDQARIYERRADDLQLDPDNFQYRLNKTKAEAFREALCLVSIMLEPDEFDGPQSTADEGDGGQPDNIPGDDGSGLSQPSVVGTTAANL